MATAAWSALRPERFTFKNGLVLLHNRAASNPSVVVRALVRAGASRETPGDHGLASMTGRMLRPELDAFLKAWYGPNQTTLIVVGDVELDEAATAGERLFGNWPTARLERVEEAITATDLPPAELREIDMVGKTQADIVLGLP